MTKLSVPDADIVCSRAKNHFDPGGTLQLELETPTGSGEQRGPSIDAYRHAYKPLHPTTATSMVRPTNAMPYYTSDAPHPVLLLTPLIVLGVPVIMLSLYVCSESRMTLRLGASSRSAQSVLMSVRSRE